MTNRIAIIGTGFRPSTDGKPPVEIAAIVSDGFEAELIQIPNGIFPANPDARAIVDTQYRDAGLRAAAAGCEAIYINTNGDYGLTELRGALDLPIIGAGETAYRIAATFGQFAVVTIWPPALDFIRQRVLQRSGTITSFIGVTHLSEDAVMASLADEDNFVTDMRSCSLTSIQRIRDARDAAIEAGAAAVVLGCTCMGPAAAAVGTNGGAPTLDSMTLGYRFAEYCLSNGLQPQEVNYKTAAPQLMAGVLHG